MLEVMNKCDPIDFHIMLQDELAKRELHCRDRVNIDKEGIVGRMMKIQSSYTTVVEVVKGDNPSSLTIVLQDESMFDQVIARALARQVDDAIRALSAAA